MDDLFSGNSPPSTAQDMASRRHCQGPKERASQVGAVGSEEGLARQPRGHGAVVTVSRVTKHGEMTMGLEMLVSESMPCASKHSRRRQKWCDTCFECMSIQGRVAEPRADIGHLGSEGGIMCSRTEDQATKGRGSLENGLPRESVEMQAKVSEAMRGCERRCGRPQGGLC